jgi:nitric oxide reductase large subunit
LQTKRDPLISKGWMQAVALVGVCGFLLLGILAYRTYTDEPPIPSKVTGANGQLLFTGEDVLSGQEANTSVPACRAGMFCPVRSPASPLLLYSLPVLRPVPT